MSPVAEDPGGGDASGGACEKSFEARFSGRERAEAEVRGRKSSVDRVEEEVGGGAGRHRTSGSLRSLGASNS